MSNPECPSERDESDGGDHEPRETMVPAYMTGQMRRQFLSEMVKKLPVPMQNRITVLKNIQLDLLKIESDFYNEVYELEKNYYEKYKYMFEKRAAIVKGTLEPEMSEPNWKEDPVLPAPMEHEEDFSSMVKEFESMPTDAKGIPNFWLTIFRNTEILAEIIFEWDTPVLKKMTDLTIQYEGHSYTLEFHFDQNEYFSNPVLTKTYFLKSEIDEDYPFGYEGPEIYRCKGCTINWENNKNLTVKTIKKKQKHKDRGVGRTVFKKVPNDTFFNFFNPPELVEGNEDDDDIQSILAADFEVGNFLRSRIIPKAVLYYTGDVIDEDTDSEEDEGEDEDASDEGDK